MARPSLPPSLPPTISALNLRSPPFFTTYELPCACNWQVRSQKLEPAYEAADLASKLHAALWTLICDAKTRRRKPNGNLVTDEEEAAAAAEVEAAAEARSALWKEREKTMAAGSTADAADAMAARMQ